MSTNNQIQQSTMLSAPTLTPAMVEALLKNPESPLSKQYQEATQLVEMLRELHIEEIIQTQLILKKKEAIALKDKDEEKAAIKQREQELIQEIVMQQAKQLIEQQNQLNAAQQKDGPLSAAIANFVYQLDNWKTADETLSRIQSAEHRLKQEWSEKQAKSAEDFGEFFLNVDGGGVISVLDSDGNSHLITLTLEEKDIAKMQNYIKNQKLPSDIINKLPHIEAQVLNEIKFQLKTQQMKQPGKELTVEDHIAANQKAHEKLALVNRSVGLLVMKLAKKFRKNDELMSKVSELVDGQATGKRNIKHANDLAHKVIERLRSLAELKKDDNEYFRHKILEASAKDKVIEAKENASSAFEKMKSLFTEPKIRKYLANLGDLIPETSEEKSFDESLKTLPNVIS